MTTRSGLSIKKVTSVKSMPGTSATPSPASSSPSILPPKDEKTNSKTKRKHGHKPLSHMSFVTRHYLCLRVPEFDLAGFVPNKECGNPRTRALFNQFRYLSVLGDESFDDDTNDDVTNERKASLDAFILEASENLNNNKVVEITQEQTEDYADGASSRPSLSSTSRANRDCPLVKFFSENRLDDFIQGRSENEQPRSSTVEEALSEDITTEDLKWAKHEEGGFNPNESDAESSQEGTVDTVDSDTVFINASQLDSEDAMSISSDVTLDVDDGIPMSVSDELEVSPDCDGDSGLVMQTKTIKLRDVQLTLNVIDVAGGQKVIKCSECEQVFLTVSDYVPHLKTHMKLKNKCFLCGKLFSRSWLLKGHMRTHTGEKPFPCPHAHCTRAFADKSNLRAHLLTHTNAKKAFKCGKCGRGFAQKRYLHKHNLEVCRQNL